MHLPAILPPELGFLSAVQSEQELMAVVLARSTEQRVLFFDAAASDGNWSEQHLPLLSALLDDFTQLFLTRQLSPELLVRISQSIHRHYRVLNAAIPKDLAIDVRGRHFDGYSLLFGAESESLRELMLDRAPDTKGRVMPLQLGVTSLPVFETVADYVKTGRDTELLTKSKDELLEILVQAVEWRMPEFRALCIQALKHYIDPQVTIELLATSQYYHMADLRAVCCERWNQFVTGFLLESQGEDELAVVISHYHEIERPLLESVVPLVTRFALRGNAAQDPLAIALLQQARRIKCLDLSETNACLPAVIDAAPLVIELRLASCYWLEGKRLLELMTRFPTLRRLDLGGNTHFDDDVWFRLRDQHQLEALRLAHCHQLEDKDLFTIVALIGSELRELDVSWCVGLSDVGVYDVLRNCVHLVNMNLSHCPNISDRTVKALAQKRGLQVISLAGCMAISDEPVLQLALNSPQLRQLDVSYCRLGDGVTADIRRRRPQLQVISI